MEDNKIVKHIYTLFLGVLLVIFVGVGINTFYPQPESPKYPSELMSMENGELTKDQKDAQAKYNKDIASYDDQSKPYNTNVSILALAASVVLVITSIKLELKIRVLSDGVILGGLFTLIYSIIRSFGSDNSKYTFIVVSVSLVMVLYLGYHRFVKAEKNNTSKKSSKKK